MMSMWMMSAEDSTRLTSSARCARSAERIDAASFPMWADCKRRCLVWASGGPFEGGDEHPVRPVPMRPESMPGSGRGARGPRRRDRHEIEPVPDDRIARGVGLRARERADRVHEAPARPEEVGAGGRD